MTLTGALVGLGTSRRGRKRGMLWTPTTCAGGTWSTARTRFSRQSGSVILEVLISSVIVGVAVVGVALMFATGQAYITAEGDNRVALFLAQQKIEQLRALGYTALAVTDNSVTEPPATAAPEDPVPNHPGYIRTWSVACVDQNDYTSRVACAGATSPAKRIRVTVQTSLPNPRATPVTLQSVLAGY